MEGGGSKANSQTLSHSGLIYPKPTLPVRDEMGWDADVGRHASHTQTQGDAESNRHGRDISVCARQPWSPPEQLDNRLSWRPAGAINGTGERLSVAAAPMDSE